MLAEIHTESLQNVGPFNTFIKLKDETLQLTTTASCIRQI